MVASAQPVSARVLTIGEILIDFVVSDGATTLESAETFVSRSGGAPANAAVALSRLGVPSAFCGVAGVDPFGSRLRDELTAEGVDTSRLRQTDAHATTLAYAWKDARGDGHFWILRGADSLLSEEDAQRAGIANLSVLVVGSVSLAAEPSRSAIERAVSIARQEDVVVVFDVNLRPTLWPDLASARTASEEVIRSSNLVKLSLDDAIGLFGEGISPDAAIQTVRALGPKIVVLTDGERGSWFNSGFSIIHVPAFDVDAIEPTGAGDAFTAAIIARSIASDWTSLTIDDVRYASAAGALATTQQGAWEGLPDRTQLESFQARH